MPQEKQRIGTIILRAWNVSNPCEVARLRQGSRERGRNYSEVVVVLSRRDTISKKVAGALRTRAVKSSGLVHQKRFSRYTFAATTITTIFAVCEFLRPAHLEE